MRYLGAKTIMSSFTWNDSTPLIDGSSFPIGSDTILYYLRNVLIVNKLVTNLILTRHYVLLLYEKACSGQTL